MDTQELYNIIQKLKENGWVPFLWHVDDVKNYYKVSDEQAIDVLEYVHENDWITEQINEIIDDYCHGTYERIEVG